MSKINLVVVLFLFLGSLAIGCSSSSSDGQTPDVVEPGVEPTPAVVEPGVDPTPSVEPEAEPDVLTATVWDLDGTQAPLVDGADVPWVWGFQGGTMIRPMFIFPPQSGLQLDDIVNITIEHAEKSATDLFEVEDNFRNYETGAFVYRDGQGRLIVGPFDDQLAWGPITDTQMKVTIAITSDALPNAEPMTLEVTVRLIDPAAAPPHACDSFGDVETTGCSYVDLPGEVELIEINVAASAGCSDGISVEGIFHPDPAQEMAIDACHEESLGYAADAFATSRQTIHPRFHQDCAVAAGVVVDARFPAVYVVEAVGTCNPTPELKWGDAMTECRCD